MANPGVLQRLGATRPARCYGRHPTLRRSGPQWFSKDRPLDTPRGAVGFSQPNPAGAPGGQRKRSCWRGWQSVLAPGLPSLETCAVIGAMLVETVVPRALVRRLDYLETDDSKFEVVDDPALRFGVVEVAAILALIKTGEEVVEHAIKIWKLLRAEDNDELRATLRSPVSGDEVQISPDDLEDDVRESVEEAFGEG
jgi:hypothetical protein